jgi:hypothetical protein
MELSPSWEAASCAATQELLNILWNPKFHYRVHMSLPMFFILGQINPVHTTPSYLRSILLSSTHLRLPSWESPVGIATDYELDDGSSSPGMVKNFLFSTSSRPALGSIQPPIQWVPEALSPGVKRPGREAEDSAEVKKMWVYTSTPS